jgi:uncharacterized protein involved in oxidation of intracellular sulfur
LPDALEPEQSSSSRQSLFARGRPASMDNQAMTVLLILNDPPYGTERSYNALRLALALAKAEGTSVRVFLMGDAIGCAKRDQKTPEGYYNLERMLKGLVTKSIPIGACGTCMDARGFAEAELTDGVRRSSMAELATWTIESEKVLVF